MKPTINVLYTPSWSDYELLDSGGGNKLERFGEYVFIRPEHQALWSRKLSNKIWAGVHGVFQPISGNETGGRWEYSKPVKEAWKMRYGGLVFEARISNSRHFGVFPEQAVHWDWITEKIQSSDKKPKILNLFGYTGIASLIAAKAGAAVTHIDASKKAVGWAKSNQNYSALEEKPIRWLVDDALKFVQREERRASFYDGIIMDPPKFGRGPKGEVWDSLEMLPTLLESCRKILTPKPLFIVITAYAIRASSLSLYYLLSEAMAEFNGETECGELAIRETSSNRCISTAIYSKWSAKN